VGDGDEKSAEEGGNGDKESAERGGGGGRSLPEEMFSDVSLRW
jgi:hypothetical protein